MFAAGHKIQAIICFWLSKDKNVSLSFHVSWLAALFQLSIATPPVQLVKRVSFALRHKPKSHIFREHLHIMERCKNHTILTFIVSSSCRQRLKPHVDPIGKNLTTVHYPLTIGQDCLSILTTHSIVGMKPNMIFLAFT